MPRQLTECIRSAQQSQSIGEWKAKEPELYSLARREGWVGKCFAHIDLEIEVTDELKLCLSYSAFFSCLSEWCAKHGESFDLAKENGWLEICSEHMTSSRAYDHNLSKIKRVNVDDYCSKLISSFSTVKVTQDNAQL